MVVHRLSRQQARGWPCTPSGSTDPDRQTRYAASPFCLPRDAVRRADGVAPPFDRLVHDRVRAEALFGFEYVLEMYKPQRQRRWGYFALPILHRDLAAWLRFEIDG